MQPIDPTQAQLDNRLSPTPVTLNTPSTAGLFREGGDFGSMLYSYDPTAGKLNQFNILDPNNGLITQDQKQQAGSNGAAATIALANLKSQYGIDFNSLASYNLADTFSKLKGTQNADGAMNYNQSINNVNGDFLRSLGFNAPQSQQTTINNTPNSLAPGITQTQSNPFYTGQRSPAPPTSVLQPGATGDQVKALQDYLVTKGLLTPQDLANGGYGTYGPLTTAAVAKLQTAQGVNNTGGVGIYGPKTIASLSGQGQPPTYTAPSAIGSSNIQGSGSAPAYTQPNTGAPQTAPTTSPYMIQSPAEGPQDTQISGLIKQVMDLNNQEAGKADYQNQENTANGVDSAQKAVTDLTAIQQRILNDNIVHQNAVQTGEGVTTAVDNRQKAEQQRLDTIASAQNESLLAAAKGNLADAQALANKAVSDKFSPIEAAIKSKMDNIALLKADPNTTAEEKARLDAIQASLDQQKANIADAKAATLEVQKVAVAAASYLKNFVPTSQFPDVTTALKAIQAAPDPVTAQTIATATGLTAPTVKNGTWSSPYMLGGSYVQKNDTTGEIRTAVNPPNAPSDASVTVGAALTDAQNAIKQGADPTAVRKAYLAKYPSAGPQWDSYFADANKPNAAGTNAETYPTPALAPSPSLGASIANYFGF